MKALHITALCAALAAGQRGLHLVFPHARSGVINIGAGSNAALQAEVASSDPKVATLSTVAIDTLKSDQVLDPKVVVVGMFPYREVVVGGPGVIEPAFAAFIPVSELQLSATLTKDNPNEASSPWTSQGGTGILWQEIAALVETIKPSRTVGALVSALEDVLVVTNNGAAGVYVVIDQADENVRVYTSISEITAHFAGTVAAEAEFTQTLSTPGTAAERLFGE